MAEKFLVPALVRNLASRLDPCQPTCDESCDVTCGELSCDVTCGPVNHSCGSTCSARCGVTLRVFGGF